MISSCLRTGFQPRVGFVARDWMAKLGLVAAGLGITLVPTLAADAVRADVAVVPLDRRDLPVREVHAALARGLTPSPAAHAFLELLKERSAALTAAASPGGGHGDDHRRGAGQDGRAEGAGGDQGGLVRGGEPGAAGGMARWDGGVAAPGGEPAGAWVTAATRSRAGIGEG